MAQTRSPRYPAIGLAEAITGAKAIYEKEHLSKVDQEVVAKRLGSTSLNGRALSRISALRKYGLLGGTGDELYVTQDAVVIIADPVESTERRAAISRAAHRPDLFAKLFKRYPEKAPSEDALRSYLMKEGFTAGGVRKAAKAFLATLGLVTKEGGDYDSPTDDDIASLPSLDFMSPPVPETLIRPQSSSHTQPPVRMRQDVFTLEEGNAVLQWPESLSPESYEDFRSWIEIVMRKIERSTKH